MRVYHLFAGARGHILQNQRLPDPEVAPAVMYRILSISEEEAQLLDPAEVRLRFVERQQETGEFTLLAVVAALIGAALIAAMATLAVVYV